MHCEIKRFVHAPSTINFNIGRKITLISLALTLLGAGSIFSFGQKPAVTYTSIIPPGDNRLLHEHRLVCGRNTGLPRIRAIGIRHIRYVQYSGSG
jgi:hypothetical protein